MISINYPSYDYRLKEESGKELIHDSIRKRWVRLTPEEWVRQNFIQYLIQIKKIPASLIAVEKEIRLPERKKRFDILIFDADHKPWMMVECKSMDVPLSQKVVEQILNYHLALPVSYLVLTNGRHCYAALKRQGKFELLNELPVFSE